ncbi:hypothetical protein QTJ16_006598 [Diplocarpon rosae]|uniref:Nitrogen regulatory protein areA GATA-like domain-containing protein n=1 Tax=Diplocarpon rosae TaxID=946125 RepID=A0AAD9SVZ7_9HELO|nr:hypothetical protein QTJ16_006598 [Diplocarpon rosae]
MFAQDEMPQDEYFEWEDIVLNCSRESYRMPSFTTEHHGSQSQSQSQSRYQSNCESQAQCHTQTQTQTQRTLPRTSSLTTGFKESEDIGEDFCWDEGFTTYTDMRSTTSLTQTSLRTETQTSLTINWTLHEKKDQDRESPINFPSYDAIDLGLGGLEDATPIVSVPEVTVTLPLPLPIVSQRQVRSDPAPESEPETDLALNIELEPATHDVDAQATYARDCASVSVEPSESVNYLLHTWREPDVAASWRHIVSRRRADSSRPEPASMLTARSILTQAALRGHAARKQHNTTKRLENASWRTWAKLRFGLRTVEPQTINWSKHCDDTCLHGPFAASRSLTTTSHPAISRERTPSRESREEEEEEATEAGSRAAPYRPKSILKKPSTAEILMRGSIPIFTHRTYHQPPLQSPTETSTSIGNKKPSRKSVKFLEEVRQYTIVTPVGDRQTQRMVKKARSTSLLPGSSYIVGSKSRIDPTSAVNPAPEAEKREVVLERAQSYWSPDSLWRYGAALPEENEGEWGWAALPSDPDPDCSGPFTRSSARAVVEMGAPDFMLSPRHRAREIGRQCEKQWEREEEDEIDYISLEQPGFCSSSSAPSTAFSSSSSSSSSEDSGEDESEEFIVRDRLAGNGKNQYMSGCGGKCNSGGEMGIGIGMGIGIHVLDEEERELYQEIMEEFELGY